MYDSVRTVLDLSEDLTPAKFNEILEEWRAQQADQEMRDLRRNIGDNPNPITRTTVMCICRWHYSGDSIKIIARLLNRTQKIVKKLIKQSLRNGQYADFVLYGERFPDRTTRTVKQLQQISTTFIGDKATMLKKYAEQEARKRESTLH